MADKEFKIKINTDGNPAGAKEVEKAIEEVNVEADKLESVKPPLTPEEVRPAVGSLSALRDELQRLERELSDVPVGSNAFLDLADKVKVAQRQLGEAEAQSRKLAGTVGRSGNAGMAVLEFSRAFEDAQYGLRGVLNNIPQLIAMLGGGAGLAGVISVLAVVGAQVWEKIGATDEAEDSLDAVAEAADKLATKLKALSDRRKEIAKIPTSDMGAALKEETTALKLQTEGFRQNIQALKDRIAAAAALDAALTQGALGDVDRLEAGGSISADEAANRRAGIEGAARQREIQRNQELSKLDDAVAIEAKAAAQRELQLAEFKKRAADERLREAEEEEQRLKAALKRRNDIDALRAQVDAAEEELLRAGVDDSRRTRDGAQGFRAANDNLGASIVGDYTDRFKEANEQIARNIETFVDASERLADLEKGGVPAGQEAIAKETGELLNNIQSLREAVGEAAKDISDKTSALQLATQSSDAALNRGAANRQDQQNLSNAENVNVLQERLSAAGDQSAEKLAQTLEAILGVIGDAAKQPGVQDTANRVSTMLKDGFQASEEGPLKAALLELTGMIRTSDTRRAGLVQQVIQGLSDSVSVDQRFSAEIREVKARMRSIELQLGNPNN